MPKIVKNLRETGRNIPRLIGGVRDRIPLEGNVIDRDRDDIIDDDIAITFERGKVSGKVPGSWYEVEFEDRIIDPIVVFTSEQQNADIFLEDIDFIGDIPEVHQRSLVNRIEEIVERYIDEADIPRVPRMDFEIIDHEIDIDLVSGDNELIDLDEIPDVDFIDTVETVIDLIQLDPEELGEDLDITEADLRDEISAPELKFEVGEEIDLGRFGSIDASHSFSFGLPWVGAALAAALGSFNGILFPILFVTADVWNSGGMEISDDIRERLEDRGRLIRDLSFDSVDVLDSLGSGTSDIFEQVRDSLEESFYQLIMDLFGEERGILKDLADHDEILAENLNEMLTGVEVQVEELSSALEDELKHQTELLQEAQIKNYDILHEITEKKLEAIREQSIKNYRELLMQTENIQGALEEQTEYIERDLNEHFKEFYAELGFSPELGIALPSVQIRNVSSQGFEWRSQGDQTIHYIAIGKPAERTGLIDRIIG